VTAAYPALALAGAACIAFALRKRLRIVGPFSLAAIAAAAVLVAAVAPDTIGTILDLDLRVTALGRLASLVILATLLLLVLDVWIDEPAYNFFPTALAVGAAALAVLVVTAPLAIFASFSTDFTAALALSAVLLAVSAALLLGVKLVTRGRLT